MSSTFFSEIFEHNHDSDEIWTPDLTLFNAVQGDHMLDTAEQARITNDGVVRWTPMTRGPTECGFGEFYAGCGFFTG